MRLTADGAVSLALPEMLGLPELADLDALRAGRLPVLLVLPGVRLPLCLLCRLPVDSIFGIETFVIHPRSVSASNLSRQGLNRQ